jgi:orotate phosphoribosyltransferase
VILTQELVACGALRFGTFTLTSGKTSSYYVDIKAASSQPRLLKAMAQGLRPTVGDAEILAGVELGAVPILVALALECGLPYVIIRKQPKAHGTGKRIEGPDVRGKRILLIEDVTTTGKSVLEAVQLLRAEGAKVDRVETVVDRGEGATEALAAQKVRLGALVSAPELLALSRGATR